MAWFWVLALTLTGFVTMTQYFTLYLSFPRCETEEICLLIPTITPWNMCWWPRWTDGKSEAPEFAWVAQGLRALGRGPTGDLTQASRQALELCTSLLTLLPTAVGIDVHVSVSQWITVRKWNLMVVLTHLLSSPFFLLRSASLQKGSIAFCLYWNVPFILVEEKNLSFSALNFTAHLYSNFFLLMFNHFYHHLRFPVSHVSWSLFLCSR